MRARERENHSTVESNSNREGRADSSPVGAPFEAAWLSADTTLMAALDAVAAVVGLVAMMVVLIAVVSPNTLPRAEVEESAFLGAPSEGSAIEVKGASDAADRRTIRRMAAFLDGSVGGKAFAAAIQRRLMAAAERRARLANVEAEVRVAKGQQFASLDHSEAPTLSPAQTTDAIGMSADARPIVGAFDENERAIFDHDATMFFSLAQYRDVLCPLTVREIYSKARNPRRVFAGIVDQRHNQTNTSWPVGYPIGIKTPIDFKAAFGADATCMPWYMMKDCATSDFCPTDNIRIRHDWPTNARGPTWGRFMGALLYQGEHYFIMIDSHSLFVRHWDMQLVYNLAMVPRTSKKAVLTHYPAPFEAHEQLVNVRFERSAMMMCHGRFLNTGIIRMNSRGFHLPGYPAMQPFSAGGFVAGDAQMLQDVPFDPYLYYVFDGEEVLFAARLWTHGYDLFTPANLILFHNYDRHGSPRFGEVMKSWHILNLAEAGRQRVRYFMHSYANGTSTLMVPK